MRYRIGIVLAAAVLCLAATATQADLAPYSQDFEALVQADPAALTNDGWKVFGNVFTPAGGYLYGYGPFDAPNGGPGFCGIDVNQGGPPQGAQQLVVYNDYNSGEHANGNIVEANVFQEQVVGAVDVGSTWVFQFDAKLGNIAGGSTALAFFKTLDPNAGYALTNFITVDMTSIPVTWGTYSLSIFIDATLPGQILQFGFLNTATNYEGSGIFYDNIDFRTAECGNGALDPGEACDDGNTVPDDGCDENCQSEFYGIPTVSEWGLIIMMLLLLTAGTIALSSLRWPVAHGSVGAPRMGGPEWTAPPFDLGLLLRVAAGVMAVALLGFAAAFGLTGTVSSVDVVGSLLCVPIVSYLVHLFVLRMRG